MTDGDPLAVLEAAYDLGVSDDAWLRGILTAAQGTLGDNGHLVIFTMRFESPTAARVGRAADIGFGPKLLADFKRAAREMRSHGIVTQMRTRLVSTLSEGIGVEAMRASPMAPILDATGSADTIGVVGVDSTGRGVVLSAGLRRRARTSARARRLWTLIGIHLAAGHRLRTTLRRAQGDGDAVLTPRGRVLHAEGEAKHEAALEALRHTAIGIDRARGRLRKSDPEQAASLWGGLVSGRWSLVDRFDRDGRRYVIARRNEPRPRMPLALTVRERQVVAHALVGHSSKVTSYALGVPASTVSEALRSAALKLGVRSRVELIHLLATFSGGLRPT